MAVFRRAEIDQAWKEMRQEIEDENLKGVQLFTGNILDLCKQWLKITPTLYQEKFLLDQRTYVVARWARQTGKSTAIAALCLYLALHNGMKRVVILAPSHRQSRKLIQRIAGFIPKSHSHIFAGRRLKTRLDFINGSSIEALPNSPETIRGETCDLIILDEAAFVRYDRELYDAMIYAITTTNGRFIALSTPGSRDSLFYEMCTNNELYSQFSRHHVSYMDALAPNGPLQPEIVESLRVQMKADPWRWRREMEAEFAEDEEAFFPMSKLEKCISYDLETYDESIVMTGPIPGPGQFYVGCDLGKKQDHSVIAVVEKKGKDINLVHMRHFKLETDYAHVIGYMKRLGERLDKVRVTSIDQTGVGEYIVEDAVKAGVKNAEGTMLTVQEKENHMFHLRTLIEEGRLHFAYDPDLMNEMNTERFELSKTGQTQFSNPSGTHDDRLWSLALAAYASRYEIPEYHPVVLAGKRRHGDLTPNLPRSLFRH